VIKLLARASIPQFNPAKGTHQLESNHIELLAALDFFPQSPCRYLLYSQSTRRSPADPVLAVRQSQII